MGIVFYALSFAAIAVMAYAVLRVMTLRKKVKGGVVGSTWDILTGLILMFMAGYLATPFFPMLPQTFKDLLVGVIFFFGAVFVVIVIKLFHRIVSDLGL